MSEEVFAYGGYHFIPERQFTEAENDFVAISRRQQIDTELGLCEPGYAYESKYPYSHASFMAASPDKDCDLFRCVENGKLYLPCEHDLQEYREPTRYEKHRESADAYRSKVRRFTLQFSLHDTEAREWFEQQPEKGDYLKSLILRDKERQLYPKQDASVVSPKEPEKRMAGDYEIIQAFLIGDKEIVMGENQNAAKGERYMCAFCDRNEIFALHTDVMVSDDFCEIAKLYADRLGEQAEKTRIDLLTPKIQGIQNEPLNKEQCTPISYKDDLNNRIVVIKPEVLRREYRRATNQIKLCIGGFGASPNSRGSACFCVDLYSGKTSRYERMNVMGTLTEEQLPKWAAYGLENYRQEQRQKKASAKEER